jgi:hypothetical protein
VLSYHEISAYKLGKDIDFINAAIENLLNGEYGATAKLLVAKSRYRSPIPQKEN